ncbi:MAG: nicotinate-nucleotide adenylyltransferase [Bacteroidota bacterium]
MKIGILGGTFNPPHIGHLITAEKVRTELGLEKIIFIPSFISPHKQEGESALSLHRLAMIRLAVADNPYFECSDIEVTNKETSYTLHTLEQLHKNHPNDSFFLIIGMDNYLTFHLWKEPAKVLDLATLVVMNRPGYPKQVNEIVRTRNTQFIEVPNIDISASEIRSMVAAKRSIRYIVPDGVEEYIATHTLYR